MSRRARYGTVLVALLVVLAGCNAFSSTGDDEPDDTVTPVPIETPTETKTETPVSSSPAAGVDWITDNETIDVRSLVRGHTRYLSDRSFTLIWTKQTRGGSGRMSVSFDRRVNVQNESTYLERENVSTIPGTVTRYVAPNSQYRRVERLNGTAAVDSAVRTVERPQKRFATVAGSAATLFLPTESAETAVVERNGRRYVQIYSRTTPEYVSALYSDFTVRNFTTTAWIDPEGYLKTLHFEFVLESQHDRVRIEQRYTYTNVGNTTVSEPAWVPSSADSPSETPSAVDTPTSTDATAAAVDRAIMATEKETTAADPESGESTRSRRPTSLRELRQLYRSRQLNGSGQGTDRSDLDG